jgi:hypothetical protein
MVAVAPPANNRVNLIKIKGPVEKAGKTSVSKNLKSIPKTIGIVCIGSGRNTSIMKMSALEKSAASCKTFVE